MDTGIDRGRITELLARENAAYVAAHPKSMALWQRGQASMPNGVPMSWLRNSFEPIPMFVDEGVGSHFRDADGHDYLDMNIADMSMFTGYAPPPVVEAVSRRMAQGSQFMAAGEDGIWVAEELARRYTLPRCQITPPLYGRIRMPEVVAAVRSTSRAPSTRPLPCSAPWSSSTATGPTSTTWTAPRR